MKAPRDPAVAGLFVGSAIAGWIIVQVGWYPAAFPMYALALAVVGFIGGAATGRLFLAPAGLLIGEAIGLTAMPRFLVFDVVVVAAALSIAVLAGLVGRTLRRAPTPDS